MLEKFWILKVVGWYDKQRNTYHREHGGHRGKLILVIVILKR